MARLARSSKNRSFADRIRRKIEAGGERVWRVQDFPGLPATAITQTFSRLARSGTLERIGKGLYYRPRQTAFGASRPNPSLLRELPLRDQAIFPAGLTAANLLGFSTQVPALEELATTGTSVPRAIVGRRARVHTRRPEAWRKLTKIDGAILDFLRRRGEPSELSPPETAKRLLEYLREDARFERLAEVAGHEPPRVRALLGALGEELGKEEAVLRQLRSGLNPLSRFEFGPLSILRSARSWQAKERAPGETLPT